MTKRIISYVDGFNLYFGLRSKKWKDLYWLDLAQLTRNLAKSDQEFVHCHYFTARIRQGGAQQAQDVKRQNTWLDAVEAQTNVSTQYGHYLSKPASCRTCGATWNAHEEKMTDVNIASQILVDAYEDAFDTALVISGDSDLTTPVTIVRKTFPNKRIVVAFPPGRHSAALKRAAHAHFQIGRASLKRSQMPRVFQSKTGHQLHRPSTWS